MVITESKSLFKKQAETTGILKIIIITKNKNNKKTENTKK